MILNASGTFGDDDLKYIALAGAVALTLTGQMPVHAQNAGGQPRTVFQCFTGTKRIQILKAGSNLIYQFGRPGRAEIVIVGSRAGGNLYQAKTKGTRGGSMQVRFVNGDFSYAIFNNWSLGNVYQHGAFDESGLVVFKGSRKISTLRCKDDGGFAEDFDIESLPTDVPPFSD